MTAPTKDTFLRDEITRIIEMENMAAKPKVTLILALLEKFGYRN